MPPTVSINDVTVLEGNNSTTTFATFTVRLSEATAGTVLVNFMTANGSATAGEDYTFASGSLTFQPGESTKTITVAVKGDKRRESDETFQVNLSGADGATIADAQGAGIIRNDDK